MTFSALPTERTPSPSMREKKTISRTFDIKELQEDGRFAGYASVFDVVDSQKDVIKRGAFMRSIHKRAGDIKLLWQHRQQEPVGMITRIFEDSRGLYVEGRLLMSVARAKEAYALMKEGVIKGMSIGYSPKHYSLDPDSGVRTLNAVDLWEISLVTFPANADAQISVVKSAHEAVASVRAMKANSARISPSSGVFCEEISEKQWRQAQQAGHVIALQDAIDRAQALLER